MQRFVTYILMQRYDVNDVILRQVMVMVLLYEEYNCTVLLLLLNNAAQA